MIHHMNLIQQAFVENLIHYVTILEHMTHHTSVIYVTNIPMTSLRNSTIT